MSKVTAAELVQAIEVFPTPALPVLAEDAPREYGYTRGRAVVSTQYHNSKSRGSSGLRTITAVWADGMTEIKLVEGDGRTPRFATHARVEFPTV